MVEVKDKLNDDFTLYQEVTKNLNHYYYSLENMVAIKFVKTKMFDYTIELHILNEEFNQHISFQGISKEMGNNVIRAILRDLHFLIDLLQAYKKDINTRNIHNQYTTQYMSKLIDLSVHSIKKYEVCAITVSDLNLPSYELNYVIIGKLSDKIIKNEMTLTELSLKSTLKTLLPDRDKEIIRMAFNSYQKAYNQFCLVRDESGRYLYH